MLNQENLYQLILKECWTDILNLLYSHRKDIKSDPMLQQAASIFEQEFFKKIGNYAIERKDISENLDTLCLLHDGKFYQISAYNYKILILELVKRKPLNEAIYCAKRFLKTKFAKQQYSPLRREKQKKKVLN